MLRVILLAFALTLSAVPVVADPWDDAVAARKRGDFETAVQLFRPLAEQGNAQAQYKLGAMYDEGQGVPQDYAEALKWYRMAAEQDYAPVYSFMGDYQAAARLYRALAEKGDAEAQASLGRLYENGQGVPEDYAEAAKWYRKAAEQGDADGQNGLGIMYVKGQGVPQDYVEAATWFRMSAEQGDDNGQYRLGLMCGVGQGVPQDYVLSHMWLNLAAAQGQKEAEGWRDKSAELMTSEQLAEAQRLAREWKPK